MIIIVEGIDRVGKTTLCNKISEETKIPVHKYNGIIPYDEMKNKQETDKTLMLIQTVEELKADLIIDRSYLTDCVYGIVERGYKVGKALKNVRLINKRLQQYADKGNSVFVFLMQPTSLEESSKEHGADLSYYSRMFNEIWQSHFALGGIKSDIIGSGFYAKNANYKNIPEVVNFVRLRKKLEDEKREKSYE